MTGKVPIPKYMRVAGNAGPAHGELLGELCELGSQFLGWRRRGDVGDLNPKYPFHPAWPGPAQQRWVSIPVIPVVCEDESENVRCVQHLQLHLTRHRNVFPKQITVFHFGC